MYGRDTLSRSCHTAGSPRASNLTTTQLASPLLQAYYKWTPPAAPALPEHRRRRHGPGGHGGRSSIRSSALLYMRGTVRVVARCHFATATDGGRQAPATTQEQSRDPASQTTRTPNRTGCAVHWPERKEQRRTHRQAQAAAGPGPAAAVKKRKRSFGGASAAHAPQAIHPSVRHMPPPLPRAPASSPPITAQARGLGCGSRAHLRNPFRSVHPRNCPPRDDGRRKLTHPFFCMPCCWPAAIPSSSGQG